MRAAVCVAVRDVVCAAVCVADSEQMPCKSGFACAVACAVGRAIGRAVGYVVVGCASGAVA